MFHPSLNKSINIMRERCKNDKPNRFTIRLVFVEIEIAYLLFIILSTIFFLLWINFNNLFYFFLFFRLQRIEILLLCFALPCFSYAYMHYVDHSNCAIQCGNYSLSCFKQCFRHLVHNFEQCIKYCKYYMKQCDYFCFCMDCKGTLRPPNPRKFIVMRLAKAKARKTASEMSNLSVHKKSHRT